MQKNGFLPVSFEPEMLDGQSKALLKTCIAA